MYTKQNFLSQLELHAFLKYNNYYSNKKSLDKQIGLWESQFDPSHPSLGFYKDFMEVPGMQEVIPARVCTKEWTTPVSENLFSCEGFVTCSEERYIHLYPKDKVLEMAKTLWEDPKGINANIGEV